MHVLIVCNAVCGRPFAQSRATGRSNVFLGASNRKARLIVLHIPQLVDQVQHSCSCIAVVVVLVCVCLYLLVALHHQYVPVYMYVQCIHVFFCATPKPLFNVNMSPVINVCSLGPHVYM